MNEVIICRICQLEFHQSFLSAHVEAFHVQERQEEAVVLSCLSCPFSVSVRHKNSMSQHCLISGHKPEEVEVQFNSFLLDERQRIAQILKTSVAILMQNLEETTPKEHSPKEWGPKRKTISAKQPQSKQLPNPVKKVTKRMDEKGYNRTKSRKRSAFKMQESENVKMEFSAMNEGELVMKEEITEEIKYKDSHSTSTQNGKMTCTKCSKEIAIANRTTHTLMYAVGHVLSHLPDLKLFRCLRCSAESKLKKRQHEHLKKCHDEKINSGNTLNLGTEEDKQTIHNLLSTMFPQFEYDTGKVDLWTYV